jgi:hypothetical protein
MAECFGRMKACILVNLLKHLKTDFATHGYAYVSLQPSAYCNSIFLAVTST